MSWDLRDHKRWCNIVAGLKRNTPVVDSVYSEALNLVLHNSPDVDGDVKKLNALQMHAIQHRVDNNGRITASVFTVWSKIDETRAKEWADNRAMRADQPKKVLLETSGVRPKATQVAQKSLSPCSGSDSDSVDNFDSISTDRKQAKNTDLKARVRNKGRVVHTAHPSKKSLKRRSRLEKTFGKWLRYYFKNAFCDEFGISHSQGLEKFFRCIKVGGRFAFALPRGGGKSTIGKAGILFAVLTGFRKFVVPVLFNKDLADSYMSFFLIAMTNNKRLMEDYPEVCCFFKALEGKPHNARFQLMEDYEPSGISISGQIVFPNVSDENGKLYPAAGARIICKSIKSGVLGFSETLPNGEIIRPDLVVPDDIQDQEVAESLTLSSRIEKKIVSSLMNLAGPKVQIACYMPCTVRNKGDVSSRFLDRKLHPEFQGKTVPLFLSFPDDFENEEEKEEGEKTGLWKQYEQMWRDDLADGKGLKRCNAFYRKNREAMDKGAVVSWDKRVRKGEVSAVQTGMHLLFENGDNFYSEYQNDPIEEKTEQYEITKEIVCNHASDIYKVNELPPSTQVLTVGADINRIGIHWVAAGYDNNMTCHTPIYGKYPRSGELWGPKATDLEIQQSIFSGLKKLCAELEGKVFMCDGKEIKITSMLIDRSYKPEAVHRFVNAARYGFSVYPCAGRSNGKYKPGSKTIGKPYENCHMSKWDLGRVVVLNADILKEAVQRSFLADVGNAGGITLFKAKTKTFHKHFADHITGEKLSQKYETEQGWRYEWTAAYVGAHWDLLDCLVYTRAATCKEGLSSSGRVARTEKPKKAVAVVYRPSQHR